MRLPCIAIFFRIFAHSADGPPTLKKLPQGKNTFVELGILAATSDQLSFSQHQKTDFLFVCVVYFSAGVSDMASENPGYLSSEWPREQRGGHVDPRRQFFFVIFIFIATFKKLLRQSCQFYFSHSE